MAESPPRREVSWAIPTFIVAAIAGLATLIFNRAPTGPTGPFAVVPVETMVENGRFTLYSLDPFSENPEYDTGKPRYREWEKFGHTPVKDLAVRRRILDAIVTGIAAGHDHPAAACFSPRHAVRWEHEGQAVDLVICFECGWLYAFSGDQSWHLTFAAGSLQGPLDKLLSDAGVELAPKAGTE